MNKNLKTFLDYFKDDIDYIEKNNTELEVPETNTETEKTHK